VQRKGPAESRVRWALTKVRGSKLRRRTFVLPARVEVVAGHRGLRSETSMALPTKGTSRTNRVLLARTRESRERSRPGQWNHLNRALYPMRRFRQCAPPSITPNYTKTVPREQNDGRPVSCHALLLAHTTTTPTLYNGLRVPGASSLYQVTVGNNRKKGALFCDWSIVACPFPKGLLSGGKRPHNRRDSASGDPTGRPEPHPVPKALAQAHCLA